MYEGKKMGEKYLLRRIDLNLDLARWLYLTDINLPK